MKQSNKILVYEGSECHIDQLHQQSAEPVCAVMCLHVCVLQLDPVQKAVINHTFGVAPPKKKPIISCNICHLRFNSTVSHTLSVRLHGITGKNTVVSVLKLSSGPWTEAKPERSWREVEKDF